MLLNTSILKTKDLTDIEKSTSFEISSNFNDETIDKILDVTVDKL